MSFSLEAALQLPAERYQLTPAGKRPVAACTSLLSPLIAST